MTKTNKNEIIEKALKVFSFRVLGYLFGFVFTWIVASKYGAKTQGCFSIAFMFLALSTMLSKLGLETALVKWVAVEDNMAEQAKIYTKVLKTSITSALIVSVLLFF